MFSKNIFVEMEKELNFKKKAWIIYFANFSIIRVSTSLKHANKFVKYILKIKMTLLVGSRNCYTGLKEKRSPFQKKWMWFISSLVLRTWRNSMRGKKNKNKLHMYITFVRLLKQLNHIVNRDISALIHIKVGNWSIN